ncbi:MAG TPA: N-acetylmuramoyl-L-alanine amidase [Cyclobacteriaceae bacterium]|nr:N-acetylmuramoyl-L-alanine amidase [Cyclobacteriaceae bacterium]
MKNYHWLLDAGHGGTNAKGHYTTAPNKMFTFPDGVVFYEGRNNREITKCLAAMLIAANLKFTFINDPVHDTPLQERVARANKVFTEDKRCIYLSIHSDAMPPASSGKGSGSAVYTTKGQTGSDTVADIFAEVYKRELSQFRFRENRSDGDADQEENFYVLRQTHCPALLVENLFFDNRPEAEFLASDEGQLKIATTLFHAILETEKRQPL